MPEDDSSPLREKLETWMQMLDDGLADEVLEATSRHLDDNPEDDEVALLRSSALSDLGFLEEAIAELEELAEIYPEDSYVLAQLAQAAFLGCRFDLATECSDAAVTIDRDCTTALYLQGLLAERAGDFARADQLMSQAHQQEPTMFPAPLHLSDEDFAAVTSQAIAELPPEFEASLANVVIVEDQLPDDALLAALGDEGDPLLLGLYTGPGTDGSVFDGVEMPPRIQLFRRNIERAGATQDEIREEVRITLFHEIGHHLGYDEDGVAELGLA